MTQEKEALKLALDFIERVNKDDWILADFEPQMYEVMTAIKEALAQPEEPCDMGKMCLGCSPRNADSSCPDAQQEPVTYTGNGPAGQEADVRPTGFFFQADRQEQEPVAWRFQSPTGGWAYAKEPPVGFKYAAEPLYTAPPQSFTYEQVKAHIQVALLSSQPKPEQEPVAWINFCAFTGEMTVDFDCESELASIPLYEKEQL